MEGKRKISVRRILQLLVTIIVTTGCVMAILSASRIQDQKRVSDIKIFIKNENDCRFLDKADINTMLLDNRHVDIKNLPIAHLDLHRMEEIAQSNPWIADAQVYVDNQRVLYVNVTQRVPVLRIFETNGNSYYLDTSLHALPLSDKYTHYAAVVTNVPELKEDSASRSLKAQILTVVNTISSDSFWNAQVQEIVVTPDREFQLVPVLGNHRILIGDTSMLTDKLANLVTFYQKVLNRIGWDKYQVLDARYKDQVVASPSLPWKAPKDKAMSDMNWVKSILGNAANANDKGGDGPAQTGLAPVATNPVGVASGTPKPVITPEPPKPAPAQHHTAPTPGKTPKPAVVQAKPKAKPKADEGTKKKDKAKAAPDKKKDKKEPKKGNTPKYLYQGNNTH